MPTRSLNKVMLIGNLTRDPNLRYTGNGTAVCSFGLATNRSWAPADGGERVEKTEFHNIVAWGKLADVCAQILHKGDRAYIDGRIQTRDWKTEDGQDRRITEIVMENMMQLTPRSGYQDDSYDHQDDQSPSLVPTDDRNVTDETASSGSASKGKKRTGKSHQSVAEPTVPASDVDPSQVEDISDDIPF